MIKSVADRLRHRSSSLLCSIDATRHKHQHTGLSDDRRHKPSRPSERRGLRTSTTISGARRRRSRACARGSPSTTRPSPRAALWMRVSHHHRHLVCTDVVGWSVPWPRTRGR
jgi:hypothetical protein